MALVWKLKIPQRDSTHTDFPVLVDLSDAPALFWSTVQDGGADIRCYAEDGTTELPREVVSCDKTGETGELWIKRTLSSTAWTVIEIHADGSSTEPTSGDDGFSEDVWTDYEVVMHLDDLTDSTGNTTPTQANTTSGATGQIGSGYSFNGTSSRIDATFTPFTDYSFTFQGWFNSNNTTEAALLSVADKDDTNQQHRIVYSDIDSDSSLGLAYSVFDGALRDTGEVLEGVSGSWMQLAAVSSANNSRKIVANGGAASSTSVSTVAVTDIDRLTIGTTADSTPFGWLDGYADEVRLRRTVLSDDWLATEHANQSSPSTFYVNADNHKATVTVDAGTPAAELTDYPMLIDLSTLGPAFWDTINTSLTTYSFASDYTGFTAENGTFTNSSGYLQPSGASPGTAGWLAIETTGSGTDVSVECDLIGTVNAVYPGVALRYSDNDNLYVVAFDNASNVWYAAKRTAGTWSDPSSYSGDYSDTIPDNFRRRLRVEVTGNDFEAFLGDESIITFTDSHNNTATRHGVRAASLTSCGFANFVIGPTSYRAGGDIRTFEDDGTPLSREVVSCDPINQTGEMWVKIPTLSVSTDTVIEIHADGVSAEPAADSSYGSESVWGAYLQVVHFNDHPASGVLTNAVDGTTAFTLDNMSTTSNTVEGILGQAYPFDGTNDAAQSVETGITSTFSVQTWASRDSSWSATKADNAFYSYTNTTGGGSGLLLGYTNTSNRPAMGMHNGTAWVWLEPSSDVSAGAWHSYTATYDGTNASWNIDSTEVDTDASSSLQTSRMTYERVGRYSDTANPFDGKIDEHRVRSSVLAGTWISTEYENQSDPYTFYQATTPQSAGTLVATVTIDATEVAGTTDLTDFPVLLDLSDMPAGFWSEVRSDGGDIRVYRGTQELPREVVSCDNVGETGEVWVKVDTLSYTTDTDLTIYLDGAPDYAVDHHMGRNAVWADYELVSHDGGTTDSAGNLSLTAYGGVTSGGATGQIGTATDYDGTNDYVSGAVTSPGTLDYTMQAWVSPDDSSAFNPYFSVGERTGSAPAIGVNLGSGGDFGVLAQDNSTSSAFDNSSGGSYTGGATWYKHDLVLDKDGNLSNYVGGSSASSTAVTSNSSGSIAVSNIWIGNRSTLSTYFDGQLDELRTRKTALTADWITTEYNNQSAPGTFYSVAGVGGGPVTVDTAALASGAASTNGDFYREVTTSGTPAAGAASTSGAVERDITSTGAVTPDVATASGAATREITSTGALTAGVAATSGAVTRQVTSSGTIAANDATTSGAVEREITSSGSPSADTASTTGNVQVGDGVSATGALSSGVASTNGDFVREVVSSGTPAANASSLSGAALRVVTSSGTLACAASSTTGSATNVNNNDATGSIAATASTLAGTAIRLVTSSGALVCEDAEAAGVCERGVVVTDGTLSSNVSNMTGAVSRNGEEVILRQPAGWSSLSISTGKQTR